MIETTGAHANETPTATPAGQRPLPDGWRWVRLGDVCKVVHGRTPSKSNSAYWNGGIPWVSPKDMKVADISDSVDHISELAVAQGAACLVLAHSILLVVRSGILAHTFPVALATTRMAINQDIKALFPDQSLIVPEFLAYELRSLEPYILAHGVKKGPTVHSIMSGFIESLNIPLPPLPEQRRIAAALRARLAAVERMRAAADAQLAAARALPAAALRAVFESDEAQAWPRVRLGDVCELLPARSISTTGDTQVNTTTTACLSETGFRVEGVKSARMWAQDAAQCAVHDGEILIARSNTPELVGRVAQYRGNPPDVVASDLTIRLWTPVPTQGEYLVSYLSFLYLTGYWKERAGGASGSMKKITRSQLGDVSIPFPDSEQQAGIVQSLRNEHASSETVCSLLTRQLEAIAALPQALLRQAFAGEL